ncbi:MAG: asparagine synthase (glutamine-hydrolyzing) [Xanthomonadaceae bacterium]|jgi:asparagine synthase (glutamine-hydrolysing)|nr:asparagine synthase (glutamine-hydrolyzing) [Xanthomonadaceae bacterium]
MCGLAGLLLTTPRMTDEELLRHVQRMSDALCHRGPDDAGSWSNVKEGVALAHRRLSILDLSAAGRQPMISADGRYTLVFNGEIYNFATLRSVLERKGHRFLGHSDTEVLLAAISEWGVEAALPRCSGMFALALWDGWERCLWLARDQVGKKPLYYGWADGAFVLGSELKALRRYPGFDATVDRDVLSVFLRLDYIPAPYCIHKNIFKMMPGCLLRMDAAAVAAGPAAHQPEKMQKRFWDAHASMRTALRTPFSGDIHEAEAQLDQLLRDAVRIRTVADVPVGVFLSGGTDSAVVTALMQAQSSQPVRSFTIGFNGSAHDEAPLAKEVAMHLGTMHTELYLDGKDALAVIPRLPQMFDEPFADASQVPTALVCHLARTDVTVALSGDGGDELFFGYKRYRRALRNWQWLRRIPSAIRHRLASLYSEEDESSRVSARAALSLELGARGIGDVYCNRVSRWRFPARAVLGATEPATFYSLADPLNGEGDDPSAMALVDFRVYLPDDLLCKVDRASMAVSLEVRAPLLDQYVTQFAWSLPFSFKQQAGSSKYLLKQVLRRYVPDAMVDRDKRGFGAPVSKWLNDDLREWADSLLSRDSLRQQGYFDADLVHGLWTRFRNGERKWHTHLWNILMFQAWHEHWQSQ